MFQQAIETILKAHDLFEAFQASPDFYARFEMPGFDRLVIERQVRQVIVGHYFEQNGDLMSDPEIVFDLATWSPLEITQHPLGVYRRKFIERDGQTYVDTRFERAVNPLVRLWARNLLTQGWSNPARCKVQAEV
jgi:hypothetical protein